jgi:hypothetical protein
MEVLSVNMDGGGGGGSIGGSIFLNDRRASM